MQSPRKPLRLGFPVKVLGRPGLKSNDSRRWQNNPHLKFSLAYLQNILEYCDENDIRMYRMSSDIAPYATHPDMPQFHQQIKECSPQLRQMGELARKLDIRLSFHPSQYVIMNSPNPALVRKSVWDIDSQAEMLDCMELGDEAVVVIHVGGAYGDRQQGCERWVRTYDSLPEHARRRLVLENDDIRYSATDVLWIHERCGVRLIFDYQHFWCNNPEWLELRPTVERFLKTWPAGVRPKVHFSSPNTAMRELEKKNAEGKKEIAYQQPIWTGHADFANPFEFATFMQEMNGLEFDVMLESKSKDLALIRLRKDLPRYAPSVAARFGLSLPKVPASATPEEIREAEMAG